jgi:hypothetical protein
MSITKQEFANYIRIFNFRELFNEMGWDNDRTVQPIIIDDSVYQLQAVASKSGFKILLCPAQGTDPIPIYHQRKQIETKVTKLFQEHLIIYTDSKKQEQVWQFVMRQRGKPTKVTETRYHISQQPELLYQRASGLFFDFDDEGKITIVDVTQKVAENFYANAEKVTKQFYDKFKKQHTSFLSFIKGIKEKVDQDWYASLMLNRLMFCYFIQRKGFLDDNKNYLRDKLKESQSRKGKDRFYSFYRSFLMVLFHQGLGNPEHSTELRKDIGRIPYLNGGLFDEHELEKKYTGIDISDKAFEAIFDFFDDYEWHLDTRNTATGRDINPDVIGYIFEKYINDRSQMGAYYTKEDITEYISKNCIIPYLIDETQRQYPKSFSESGEIWGAVKQSGDRYIYEAVKRGIGEKLPLEFAVGIKDIGKRADWNKPASLEYALPTEIWREVIDRRNRFQSVKEKIETGEIRSINDFITYNLDIRQFAQDLIENTEDPDLLRHFYKSLNNVTILDPTCGSGAFLFAAMNILEPLYEACLQRMENFISDAPKGKYKFFEEVLQAVKSPEHPNLQYFIFKSIILRNLHGVDLMKEAVEIAKLRLFLKLVGAVEVDYRKPNLGLEPLPDIDFNIRSGNSLVGFATEAELKHGLDYTFDGPEAKPIIEEKCDVVARAFNRYKEIQLKHGDDFNQFKKAKDELGNRLKELNLELNKLLHLQATALKYEKWLESHQPFHWFAEFYEIIHDRSGFDVIIGNPPYVVYSASSFQYQVSGYETIDCKDLYSFVLERSTTVLNPAGSIGMIVPISIVSTDGFLPLRKLMQNRLKNIWFSNYAMRPSKLFEGVEKHLSIFVSNRIGEKNIYSTKYYRWYTEERETIFQILRYVNVSKKDFHNDSIPKIGSEAEKSIIRKIKTNKSISNATLSRSNFAVYHTRKLRYFLQFLNTAPKIYEEDGGLRVTSELKQIFFKSDEDKLIANATYLSSLFFWYYVAYSDCRNLNKREVATFPFSIDIVEVKLKNKLSTLGSELLDNLQDNSYFQEAFYQKYGKLNMQVFQPRLSKLIIDDIDTVLARHYSFTDEELDFIVNYDIKYRMGKELENGEDID